MAKNFATMTSKKLNALLETANEADAAAIKAVLIARGQTTETEAPAEAPTAENDKEAENEALAVKLKGQYQNHRCKVVPFNSIEYVDGTIVSVIHDKRNKKVMYAIRLDDGRRILKSHDAKYLEISEEVNTEAAATKTRASRASGPKKELNPDWDANTEAAKHFEHVGKLISIDENTDARITAIVPDKRSQRILYRAEYQIEKVVDDKTEVETKVIHKTSSDELIAALKSDDKTAELSAKYAERRAASAGRSTTSKTYEEKLAELDARITKVQETLSKLNQQRADMVAKHEANSTAQPAEEPASEEELA